MSHSIEATTEASLAAANQNSPRLQDALTYAKKSTEFQRKGVSMHHFYEFMEKCGGRHTLEGLTTGDICEKFVKPMTESTQSSYCDHFGSSLPDDIVPATVFVSHAWKYKFLHVICALENHFKVNHSTTDKNKQLILWFDLFTNCQHGLSAPPPFEWWCDTFMKAIQDIGHTVMVMEPWNNPITVTRAWCLWEIYCTSNTKSKFEIALSSESRRSFEEMIISKPSSFDEMIAVIDVKKADSW